jgi:hypothetical protein
MIRPQLLICTMLLIGATLLAACVRDDRDAFSESRPWSLPITTESAQPDLVVGPDGELLLSWVEPMNASEHRLRFSRAKPDRVGDAAWASPRTIAQGSDWFLNWADTPHIHALPDDSLWAHWLRSTGPGRMDYGIDLVRSGDAGMTWSPPSLVNLPDSPGDHGFVTFWTQSDDRLGMAWLDSRQKAAALAAKSPPAGEVGDSHDHHGGAPMMLRAAVLGPASEGHAFHKQDEWPLDVSTCDCCTTASAMTDRGAVVVYRGRTADEIRDTRLVRFDGKTWTRPHDVYSDGWNIAGCPVNGPVVAARGNTVWVAWYTEADGLPEVRLARSDDAGDRFATPVTVAKGAQVQGRVSIALADAHVLVAWLEQGDGNTQRLMLGRYGLSLEEPQAIAVSELAVRGRASGVPRMQVEDGIAWLVWTDVADGRPVIRGALVE